MKGEGEGCIIVGIRVLGLLFEDRLSNLWEEFALPGGGDRWRELERQ